MFLHSLFGYFECIGYFFIGPAFCKVLHNRLFSICKLKALLCLVGIELLAAPEFFQCYDEAGMLNAFPIWKSKPTKQYGLIRISCNSFNLKLFPILRFGTNLECL